MSDQLRDSSKEPALQALLLEADQHQQTLRRNRLTIDYLGLLGPLLGGLMVLLVVFPGVALREDWLAAVLIVLMSMAGLLLHFTWVEFFELIRYKYIVLYPRLFAFVEHQNWVNYLEFTTPRSLRTWFPALCYNAIAFVVLFAIWLHFLFNPALASLSVEAWGLCIVAALCLLSTVVTSYVVLLAARTLERDVKFALGRTWYPPQPFDSPLRLIPCGDGACFMVDAPLKAVVQLPGSDRSITIVVPEGFLTDLASVPRVLWAIFPPWERYGPAAVLHDYLYSRTEEEWSRADADRAFLYVMRSLGVGRFERTCIYLAVHWFGAPARAAASRRLHADTSAQSRLRERFRLGERGGIS